MNQKQAHWYPGHMHKAIGAIHEKIKWIDLVVIVIDARAMFACMDVPIVSTKPILYVVTKTDLADPSITATWLKAFQVQNKTFVVSKGKTPQSRQAIVKALHQLGEAVWQKQIRKGIKKQPLKIMITWVPNVGKSTLINLLAKQRRVNTENRPGTTRGQQWLKLDDYLLLLDTPGILPPRFTTQTTALQLALIGAMPIIQLPLDTLAYHLFDWLVKQYPELLKKLHGETPADAKAFFNHWGNYHGWLKQGTVDYDRVFTHFIQSFQKGELGKISLETLPL
jgi:ribosome biogenesis GTPase A